MKDKFKIIIEFVKNKKIIIIPASIIVILLIATIISFSIANNQSGDGYDSYDEGMLDQIHNEYVNGTNFALSNRKDLSNIILNRNSMIVYENLSDFILSPNELETAPSKNNPGNDKPDGYFIGTIDNIRLNKDITLEKTSVPYDFTLNITDDRVYKAQILVSNLNPLNNSSTDYYGEYYVATLLKYQSADNKYVLYINHYNYEEEHDQAIFNWINALGLNLENLDIKFIDLSEK